MSMVIERPSQDDFHDRRWNLHAVPPRLPYSFGKVLTAVSRNLRNFFICILLCELAGVVAILLIPVSYVASTQVLLEPLPRKPVAIASDGIADPLDSAQADSRMHVAKSERLLRFVFSAVDWPSLIARPDAKKEKGIFATALSWLNVIKSRSPESDEVRQTKTFMDFTNRVSVKRLGLSYVIEISFQAETPRTAMFMANAVTAAYLRNLVVASQLEGELLERRITTIRSEEQILKAAIKKGEIPDESFPDANARVISAAILPIAKATPKSALILLIATSTGLALGILLSVLKLQNDPIIRDGPGVFPGLSLKRLATFNKPSRSRSLITKESTVNDRCATRTGNECQALIARILEPSDFKRHRIVGFASRESQTHTPAVLVNAAQRIAALGYDPVIVTADACSSERSVEADKLLTAGSPPETPVKTNVDKVDGIAVFSLRAHFSSTCLESTKVSAALMRLSKKGPVLVDLPALEASFDAHVLARYVDEIVLVASANATRIDDLVSASEQLPARKIAGFVLLVHHRHWAPLKLEGIGSFSVRALTLFWHLGRRLRHTAWHPTRPTHQASIEGPSV